MTNERLKTVKYINDPVYGGIPITALELEIIDTPVFQRLRGLRQLARVNYVFPGAEHSRFVHSLGVLYIMGLMVEHLQKKEYITEDDAVKMRVAALLHDIGHYPFSHLGEAAYGYCEDNENANDIVANIENNEKQLYEMASSHSKAAHHEQLGKYVVMHNKEIIEILRRHGLEPREIGEIFTGEFGSRNMVYSQLLHSSLDADRLDYLLRDSYQTGVKYGLIDLQYLIRLLMVVEDPELAKENNKVLVCNKKGQHVVEHFLMSRYFHYSQVVFHKTNVAFEGMIKSMYIKLLQKNKFIYKSLKEIKDGVNEVNFLNFNDAFLEVAFEKYYKETDDEEYKSLFEMYRERIRPKVVFDIKDLYEEGPSPEFAALKWNLKKNPEKISKLLEVSSWGYQIVPISIECINGSYKLTERHKKHDEELREAIKVYNMDSKKISYLAEDRLSIINRLANYKSEFMRIYILEEKNKRYDYEKMHNDINALIQS